MDAEIDRLDSEGITSPVDASEWITGVVPVPKMDGKVRITADLRYLNSWIVPERSNQPTYDELMMKCRGMQFASTISAT